MRHPVLLPLFLLGSSLLLSAKLAAFEMDKVQVPLSHPANGSLMVLAEQQQLVVSGFSQFDRWLTTVNLTDFTSRALPIPTTSQFFDQATLANFTAPQLILLGTDGIYHYANLQAGEDASLRLLVATPSLFRVVDGVRLRQRNLGVNLGSGLTDFLIPDFEHVHLYRQQADGQFQHYPLPVPARIQTWNNNRADYSGRRHYVLDVNQDGLVDLVFLQQGGFAVFLQAEDGSFSTTPVYPDWPVALSTEQEADQRSDAGRNYSGQQIRSVEAITDLDGDGLVDIVVNVELIADALERSSRFDIYFGQQAATGLTFSSTPETQIVLDSVPTEVVIADFNGDGRQDFYIPTTKIGVSTIVRVLLRGSANLDVDFYLLSAQRRYAAKPDFRQQAKIDVSISNLRFDMPLFELIDLQGTGKKSLVLGESGKELRFYGPESTKLFNRTSERVTLSLPRDASRVKVFDLNTDGKEDLVLPFDSLDTEGQRNQLILLYSR
ncbi:FG-GAP repeat domain-containing protein [Alishewanella sp. d11]|uniref:FG-GAP repeat domain-containing protein n=1 Tax=Alishewanella sp. d11 TaxID=3414030 RepID=UPI003BF8AC66